MNKLLIKTGVALTMLAMLFVMTSAERRFTI